MFAFADWRVCRSRLFQRRWLTRYGCGSWSEIGFDLLTASSTASFCARKILICYEIMLVYVSHDMMVDAYVSCYLRRGGYVLAGVCMSLSVCLFVCLLAASCKDCFNGFSRKFYHKCIHRSVLFFYQDTLPFIWIAFLSRSHWWAYLPKWQDSLNGIS